MNELITAHRRMYNRSMDEIRVLTMEERQGRREELRAYIRSVDTCQHSDAEIDEVIDSPLMEFGVLDGEILVRLREDG